MERHVELASDAKASVGEGTCWDPRRQVLYWVDILAHEVHVYDPAANEDRRIDVGQYVGAVVPTCEDDLMLAMHHGFARLSLDSEQVTPVCDPESHLPNNRFNDGKCDPAGRFWAGTMRIDSGGNHGALYRMDADGTVHKMLEGVGISNGLAWSHDHKTMFYIDTLQSQVAAFDYDIATGDIAHRRTAIAFEGDKDHPDGMTIDEAGMLWVAFFGGSCVARCDPKSGRILEEIRLPATQITNCAFGGPALDTLYITSCRVALTPDQLKSQPLAGGLFRVKPGVRGVATVPYKINPSKPS